MTRGTTLTIAAAILAAGLGLMVWRLQADAGPRRDIAVAREWGRLAPLPASAADVHSAQRQSFFSGTVFVRFTASPAAIDAFLAASPGLRGIRPDLFTPQHRYLPAPRQFNGIDLNAYARDGHFHDDARADGLPWFDRTIRVQGRRYAIPEDGRQHSGEIVVDDIGHVVYIKTSYS